MPLLELCCEGCATLLVLACATVLGISCVDGATFLSYIPFLRRFCDSPWVAARVAWQSLGFAARVARQSLQDLDTPRSPHLHHLLRH